MTTPLTSAWPQFSIVVASTREEDPSRLTQFLNAIQTAHEKFASVEVIVTTNCSREDRLALWGNTYSFPLKILELPPSTMIPKLWREGILQAQGDLVAVTLAACTPEKNWIEDTLHLHQEHPECVGIGGVIESDESHATWVDWAIFLMRYHAYMRPVTEGEVRDIAGDHASYKREALLPYLQQWPDGFWENFIHAQMRRDGHRLWRSNSVAVTHRGSFRFVGFLKNRFAHGKQFGATRAQAMSAAERGLRFVLSPLVLPLFAWKMARTIFQKRRHRLRFLLCLPLIALFASSWAFGEAMGYGQPRRSANTKESP